MPIKAVLFDMFDTLMIIERNHAFYSPSLKRAYESLFQNGVNVTFSVFNSAYFKARDALYDKANLGMEEPHFNLRIANALRILGYEFDVTSRVVKGASLAFCEEFMRYVRIDEHARIVLEKLYGKYKLGIVSNFAIPECVPKLLNRERLAEFFSVVIVSGAVNKRKPSSEIFQKALEDLGVDAENAMFIGDTVDADIQGPQNIGMKTVYIERRPQKEIERIHPDYEIKSLNQLLEVIQNC